MKKNNINRNELNILKMYKKPNIENIKVLSKFYISDLEKVELTEAQVSEIGFGRFVKVTAENKIVAGIQNGQLIAILEQRDGQLYKPKKVIK